MREKGFQLNKYKYMNKSELSICFKQNLLKRYTAAEIIKIPPSLLNGTNSILHQLPPVDESRVIYLTYFSKLFEGSVFLIKLNSFIFKYYNEIFLIKN